MAEYLCLLRLELAMGIFSRFTTPFLLVALSVSVNLPSAFGQDDANSPTESQIQQLLNRRVDQLRKVSELLAVQFENGGESNYDRLLTVQIKLHEAEIEAAETPEARLAILEAYLKTAKKLADFTDMKFRNGEGSAVDSLLAQAAATGVEIRLLKARRALKFR
ncbi:hypothetical protein [Blastopirellula marina]|uniref:Uncharacterized protein n=1 Tax=Blastopirellula marina DSM 3645 TaxID=314230 RepID=A3ZZF6_9BACT|nr:hypothetical protein [Blastopirellula marina]EAQ78119.1 hypothetical protein DSM3645_18901 [Blastopirellula marina DSM 3645]